MKTKQDLKELKKEIQELNKKLSELTEEELQQVYGGNGQDWYGINNDNGVFKTGSRFWNEWLK